MEGYASIKRSTVKMSKDSTKAVESFIQYLNQSDMSRIERQYTECEYGGPLGRRPERVMKVRLVRPRCFVLTMLPLKSLASSTG